MKVISDELYNRILAVNKTLFNKHLLQIEDEARHIDIKDFDELEEKLKIFDALHGEENE